MHPISPDKLYSVKMDRDKSRLSQPSTKSKNKSGKSKKSKDKMQAYHFMQIMTLQKDINTSNNASSPKLISGQMSLSPSGDITISRANIIPKTEVKAP